MHNKNSSYTRVISAQGWERLVELAVERGAERDAFLTRLASQGTHQMDPGLLFAWYREMSEMQDHNDLLLAARVGANELADKLLASGADPNRRARDGTSALIYASMAGNVALVRSLVTAGANPNFTTASGDSALLLAVKRDASEIVQILITAGAQPGIADPRGFTPLMAAAANGNMQLARLLLERGADPGARNRDGRSLLVFAAIGGSTDLGRLLIDLGADVNEQSSLDQGWNPLLKASDLRRHGFMRLLVEHGANLDVSTKDGKTALMLAASEDEQRSRGDLEAVEILLNAGTVPNAKDASGWTALMYVAQYGGSDLARLLIKHGADPRIVNNKRQTALDIALEFSQHDVAEVLRSAGAQS